MTPGTSSDSSRGVSGFISRAIQDLFTTQGLPAKPPAGGPIPAEKPPASPAETRDRLAR